MMVGFGLEFYITVSTNYLSSLTAGVSSSIASVHCNCRISQGSTNIIYLQQYSSSDSL